MVGSVGTGVSQFRHGPTWQQVLQGGDFWWILTNVQEAQTKGECLHGILDEEQLVGQLGELEL